jgi:hypothetical protein
MRIHNSRFAAALCYSGASWQAQLDCRSKNTIIGMLCCMLLLCFWQGSGVILLHALCVIFLHSRRQAFALRPITALHNVASQVSPQLATSGGWIHFHC